MQSLNRAKKGDFKGSKTYGNVSVITIVVTIIYACVAQLIGFAFCAWLVASLQECGLSGTCQ